MDTSNPAVFVNAEQLRLYVGRRVRAVIQILRSDSGVVMGNSTDENQIAVKGSPPSPLSKFVEVIGIADSEKSIRAEIWTNFGDSFGMAFCFFCQNSFGSELCQCYGSIHITKLLLLSERLFGSRVALHPYALVIGLRRMVGCSPLHVHDLCRSSSF
ncbi:Replication protein A 14 kDa subunit B [Morella rubra]|uniref:Replication protein A 14 kDa subunit B n=1 Tax=Morella rubra TaxID=262757 RepID=A0A6A1WCG2_9ROSI|nr:Replication protein A 14 kDa subunit B [Morella rubra]